MKIQRHLARRWFFLAAFLFAVSLAQAQLPVTTQIIPQIVDGGAWLTTLAVSNTGATQASASLNFFQEIGNVSTPGATQPWSLLFAEMNTVQPQNLVLQPGSTLFLHTLGTAPSTTIGWGELVQPIGGSVVAYAIFTQRLAGRADQDGTAPAAAAGNRILVPFDNTNGAVTTIAIANPSAVNESILVGIRTPLGTIQPSPITLPPQGHASFTFPEQFPWSTNQSGLAELYTVNGTFSILSLRFNSGAFTTAPVYSVTGSPILIPQ